MFADAQAAIDAHDLDGLRAVLDAHPEVLQQTGGPNENELLGMAAFTGSIAAVDLLLERGADPSRANVHGWTALHQAAYANAPTLARRLLDAGAPARAEARGAGGTPLVVALFWGHRRVTPVLLEAGVTPDNLRVAAGTGDLDAIERLLGTPAAGAARAFHRPHSGFPAWTPSDDAAEVRDEAVAWAARSDRADAITALHAAGADLDADVYRGTPLTWAAFTGATTALDRLLELGADPDRRGGFGGPDHGEGVTALHLAAQNGRADVVDALLAAGADATIRDTLHGGTPADWARVGGHPALADRLS